MTSIENWVKRFGVRWRNHDFEGVLDLFAEDVGYYETPFTKLEGYEEIREEWKTIEHQEDIELETAVVVSESGRHAVSYELRYTKKGETEELGGVYLIQLSEGGKCTEFWQYFQKP